MKSKGPPYKDPPGYKYVVVENPWPGLPGDKAMLPRIAIWLRYALNNTECPEMLFYRKSRGDVVIVQFPEETDITPLLGAHYWPNFDRRPGAQTQGPKISSIFEFRYERHGHPEDHQWMGYVVDPGPPPPSMQPVPIKQPYPPPTWQSHVGKSCADLVLPIPPPRDEEEAQQPAPAAPQPPPPERSSNSMYSFAEVLPDERPAPQAQAQAQAQPVNAGPAPRRNETPSAGSSTQTQRQQKPNLFGGKGDPYEAEETASRALKAEPIEGQPLTRVKPEPQNLSVGEAAFAELQRVRAARAAQAAQSRTATADSATRASTVAPSQPTTSPAIPDSGNVETPPAVVSVKVESTAGQLPSAPRSRDPRVQVKAEPRREQVPQQEPGRSAPYRVKRELDEDDQGQNLIISIPEQGVEYDM